MKQSRPVLAAVVAASLCGCSLMQHARESTRAAAKSLTPESWDEDNPADDPGDPWIEAAGLEGRADQKRENEMDPLRLRTIFMSPRARSIERNCGIDD